MGTDPSAPLRMTIQWELQDGNVSGVADRH